jgi:hypothetical protein
LAAGVALKLLRLLLLLLMLTVPRLCGVLLFDVFSSIFLLEISCWMICCFGFGGILKD